MTWVNALIEFFKNTNEGLARGCGLEKWDERRRLREEVLVLWKHIFIEWQHVIGYFSDKTLVSVRREKAWLNPAYQITVCPVIKNLNHIEGVSSVNRIDQNFNEFSELSDFNFLKIEAIHIFIFISANES